MSVLITNFCKYMYPTFEIVVTRRSLQSYPSPLLCPFITSGC
jgi:hypothetical protein